MRQIQTFFSYNLILDEFQVRDGLVVIIDVLRASTSICAALHNGAKEVIPVAELGSAAMAAGNLSKQSTLLCGERNGVKPTGFDLGNSPAEYTADAISGKTLIFTTTNGTQVMTKTRHAPKQIISCFANVSATVEYVKQCFEAEPTEDFQPDKIAKIYLVCAATKNGFSYEDTLYAGLLAKRLNEALPDTELSDSSHAAATLYASYSPTLREFMATTEHAILLQSIGFESDIDACLAEDTFPVLPIVDKKSIKIAPAI